MKKTWKPLTAGILDIIWGIFGLLGVLMLGFIAVLCMLNPGWDKSSAAEPVGMAALFWIIAAFYFVFSVLSVVGGIFNILRRCWVLALIGSVSTFAVVFMVAAVSIVCTAMSKEEFN
jgi:hypothetical protein